jgi:filamentous hemagglutinin
VWAQIAADRNADRSLQPQIITEGNNVPSIHITTPNGAGVSLNHYEQFDVPTQGAILNNSREDISTNQAGFVKGNAALVGGTAGLIINQVNAPNPTQMKGFLEVAGTPASVVVANPSGITCDGCGFINAPHATLTTGKPLLSGSGALEGYRVEGGTITFQGSGLSSTNTNYTDILARAVIVNAQVHAGKDLRVITGRNAIAQKDSEKPAITPLEEQSHKPAFALDVAALGGMYAEHIHMVGTEAGVGVRITGVISAVQGDVELDTKGSVAVHGKIQGAKTVQIKAKGDVEASGILLSQADALHVDSEGNLTVGGTVEAQKKIHLKGQKVVAHKSSQITSREGDTHLVAAETLAVKGTVKTPKGKLMAEGQSLDFSGSTLEAPDVALTSHTGDADLTGATVTVGQRLKITTPKKLTTDRATISAPKLEFSAFTLSNVGGKLTHSGAEAFELKGLNFLNNSGGKIESKGASFTLEADRFMNTDGTLIHEGPGFMTVKVLGDITSIRGEISSNSDLMMEAVQVTNDGGLISGVKNLWIKAKSLLNPNTAGNQKGLSSQGSMTLTLDEEFNNVSGLARAGGDFTLTSGFLTNTDGILSSDSRLSITAHGAVAHRGLFKALGGMILNTQGQSFDMTGGSLIAGKFDPATGAVLDARDLEITSGNLTTDRAKVLGSKKVTLNVGTLHSHDGMITAKEALEITASGDVINTQTEKETPEPHKGRTKGILSDGALTLTLTNGGMVDNTRSALESLGAFTLTSGKLISENGAISSGMSMTLTTFELINKRAEIWASGPLDIDTQGHHLDSTEGKILSQQMMTLKTGLLTHTDGVLATDSKLKITSGEIKAKGGSFRSLGTLEINTQGQNFDMTGGSVIAGKFDPTTGAVLSARDLEIISGALTADKAKIIGSKTITLKTNALTNTDGTISAQGSLDIDTEDYALDNTKGRLKSRESMTLKTGLLTNRDGAISTNENLHITTTGDFINTQTVHETPASGPSHRKGIYSEGALDLIIGGKGDNSQGSIHSGSTLTLSSEAFTNTHGDLSSDGIMKLTTHVFTNINGRVESKGDLTLNTQGHDLITTQGRFYTDGALKIINAKTVDAEAGFLGARGDLSIAASGPLITRNTQEVLASENAPRTKGLISHGKLTLDLGGGWDNTHGSSYAGNTFEVTAAGLVTNTDGSIFGNDAMSFTSSGLDNTRGTISGQTLTAKAGDSTLTNRAGNLIARTGSLTLSGKDILNDEGLIHSAGDMTLTALEKITNTHSGTEKGILSDGALTLRVGREIDNTQGHVVSAGTLTVEDLQTELQIRSNGGSFTSQTADLSLKGKSLWLEGGTLFAPKAITLAFSDAIYGGSGTIHSYDHVDITTNVLHMTHTRNPQVTKDNPQDKGILGKSIHIKSGTLDNTHGFIAANTDLRLHVSNRFTNTHGHVEATRLEIKDPSAATSPSRALALTNTGGTLFALERLDLHAASLSNDGALTSHGDMTVDLLGPYTYIGGWTVGRDLNFTLTGGLTNQGLLKSGGKATLSAASLDNQAAGSLVGGGGLEIHTGAFTNRGVVKGSESVIYASALTNLGTGRIYGDRLAIQAGHLLNTEENGSAGTIMTRAGDLHLGVGSLMNEKGALIYSLGNLSLGGALDAAHNAVGKAGRVENRSARMESVGDMTVRASYFLNKNESLLHKFETEVSFGKKEHIWQEEGWCQFLDYCEYSTYTRVEKPVVIASDPAIMSAGQRVILDVDSGENYASQIVGRQGVFHQGVELKNTTLNVEVRQWDGWRTYGRSPHETWNWRYEMVDYGHKVRWKEMPTKVQESTRTVEVLPPVVSLTPTAAHAPGFEAGGVKTGVAFDPTAVSRPETSLTASQTSAGVAAPVLASLHTAALLEMNGDANAFDPTDHTQAHDMTHQFLRNFYDPEAASALEIPPAGSPDQQGGYSLRSRRSFHIPDTPLPVGGTATIRTVDFSPELPVASVFTPRPEPTAMYLVETDPQFTDQKQWLSSDVQLARMGVDPAMAQKRVGDGFYEQMLVRDQIIKLTGYRTFEGYRDDTAQYAALLASGVVFAQKHNLRPGVALTPAQMAQLTSPLVWLVQRPVRLKDGSTHNVLVPQVYAVVRPGAIRGDGALISGREVKMVLNSALTNQGGTIAGQERTEIHGDTLANLMGRIGDGGQTTLTAQQDILNIGGTIQGGSLAIDAGRDFVSITTSRNHESKSGSEGNTTQVRTTTIDHVASVKATDGDGSLRITSGRDSLLTGTVIHNQGTGDTTIKAKRNVMADSVQTREEVESTYASGSDSWIGNTNVSGRTHGVETKSVGTQISGGGAVNIGSGADSTYKNTQITSGGKTILESGGKTTFVDDIETRFAHTTSSDEGLFLRTDRVVQSQHETARETTIQAGGGSSVQAGGGEVRETPTLVNHTQDDTQRTLTPAGQSLVSLAMVAATLLTGGTAAGALGITNAAGAAGLNAGVGSFVTQTAINTINADGDLGKALGNTSVKQIGVSAGAAALSAGLISHITPGVTPRLDSNFKAGAGAGTKLSAMGTTQSASFASTATQATSGVTWAQGFATRLPAHGVQTVTNVAAGAILAEGNPSAIGNAALGSLATVVGTEATLPLGQAYHAGQVNPFVHKVLHGGIGAGTAAISGGNVWSGAAGAVAGELAGELYLKTQTPTAGNANQLINTTAGIGRISGGLAGLAAGGDVNTGANTGTVAAENNAAFIIPLAISAGSAAYTAWQGDGNPLKGLEKIGAGNDPLSQAVSSGVEQGVELSAKNFPEATKRAIQVLSTVGNAVDATITYVDDKTGQTFSKTWNELPPETQNMLKGAGKVLGVSLSAAQVAKVASIVKGAQTATKVDGLADAPNVNNTLSKIEANSGRSFWNKTIEINGNKVYQRDDLINANFVDSRGRTNLERMQKGLAPIGPDGKSLNLHHMLQSQDGPIAEITATFHKQNHSIIHINPSSIPSGIDRGSFDKWRVDYWTNRVNDFK